MDWLRNTAASEWASPTMMRQIMADDSDNIELDGETPFTPAERLAFRKMHREYSRASWLVKRVLPWFVAVITVTGGWAAWVSSHWKP